jgi:hypothetical protein
VTIAQFVEVESAADQAAFADQDRRMIHNGPFDCPATSFN